MKPDLLTCGLGIYSSCKKQLGMEHKPCNRDRRGLAIGVRLGSGSAAF